MDQSPPHAALLADRQRADISLRFGNRTHLAAQVDVTGAGLLSIGTLVSAILLSTAVVVHVARRPTRPSPDVGQ